MKADHPDEHLTASYLDGRLDGPARDRFEAHLTECESCRAGVTLLAGEAQDMDPRDIDTFRDAALAGTSATSPRRSIPRWPLVAATLAIGAVGFGLVRLARPVAPAPSGVERDVAGETFGPRSPAAGVVVDATGLTFRFDPIAGADRYVVSVSDEAGRGIARLEVRAPEHEVGWPDDLPAPRGTLVWTVKAMALDRTLAEARPIAFEAR